MSVQAITWAIATVAPSSTAKLVLICLANYADKDGSAHPGQKRLAEDAGVSERSVREALKSLEQAEIITREHRHRGDGTRTSDAYSLQMNMRQDLPEVEADNRQILSRQPADSAGQYKPNGLSEPVREPSDARARAILSDFDEFYAQYPRKVGRPSAERAYAKAVRKFSPAAILRGLLRAAAEWERRQTPRDKIPHPSTWLNDHRFNDNPEDQANAPDQNQPPGNAKQSRSDKAHRFAARQAEIIRRQEGRERQGSFAGL